MFGLSTPHFEEAQTQAPKRANGVPGFPGNSAESSRASEALLCQNTGRGEEGTETWFQAWQSEGSPIETLGALAEGPTKV